MLQMQEQNSGIHATKTTSNKTAHKREKTQRTCRHPTLSIYPLFKQELDNVLNSLSQNYTIICKTKFITAYIFSIKFNILTFCPMTDSSTVWNLCPTMQTMTHTFQFRTIGNLINMLPVFLFKSLIHCWRGPRQGKHPGFGESSYKFSCPLFLSPPRPNFTGFSDSTTCQNRR